MKRINLLILLFLSLSCFGQNKERIRFYKEIPYCSSKGMVWKKDTLSYYKIFSEVNLYKSDYKEYPYLYVYIDKNRQKEYYFIREKDIVIKEKEVKINMFDDSNDEIFIYKIYKSGLIFSFKLNNY